MKGNHKKRVLIKTINVRVQYGSMYLRRFLRNIHTIVTKNKIAIALAATGFFLRIYQLSDFVTFLGDQGRDAIIIKRILTFEHFPAVGPSTSIGHIYLGPFYYYFIAPWLLFFNFDPLGLAVGVALFSSFFLLCSYFILKEFFGAKTAIIATVLLTFSTTLIDFSRFSWNPNLLPFFSLFCAYFLIKALKTNKIYYFILFGAFLSFSIQLHYLALFLIIPIPILLLIHICERRAHFLKTIVGVCTAAVSFTIFSSPLIIFDLRHDFLNSRGFIALARESINSGQSNFFSSILTSFNRLNKYVFNFELNTYLLIALLITIILFALFELRKSTPRRGIFIFFIFLFIGVSLFGGPQYQHYYSAVYVFYLVCISIILSNLSKGFKGNVLVGILLLVYVYLNSQGYIFLTKQGSRQIQRAKNVALAISKKVTQDKFALTALPEKYSESTYRYFLEIGGKKPIEKDSLEKADELFVVCEVACPLIIGNPQWDIAYFAPRTINYTTKIDGITIYRLSR